MNNKISVITPSKNSGFYIEDAIQSVLQQQYDNFEHIVIDAASSDETLDILKKYPHLKWVSEPDKGQSDAMNKGFAMSTGDIIMYLNADDLICPGAFNNILFFFQKGAVFVVGKIKVLSEDGTYWINNPKIAYEDILKHWKYNAFPVNSSGYYYRREIQEVVNGFNIENDFSMDLEFLIAASKRYVFTKSDDLIGIFRSFPGTKTADLILKPGYWAEKNFLFIDKYLSDMPKDFISRYRRQRRLGFLRRQIESVFVNLIGVRRVSYLYPLLGLKR